MSKKRTKRKTKSLVAQTLRSQYERLYMPTQFTKDKIAFPPERTLDESADVEVPLELPAGMYTAEIDSYDAQTGRTVYKNIRKSNPRAGGKTDLTLQYLINKAAHEAADVYIIDSLSAVGQQMLDDQEAKLKKVRHASNFGMGESRLKALFEDDPNFIRTGGPDARHMVIDVTPITESSQTTEPRLLTGEVDGFIKTVCACDRLDEDGICRSCGRDRRRG